MTTPRKLLALPLLLALPAADLRAEGPAAPPADPPAVAVWKGGVVSESAYRSWSRFRRLEGDGVEQGEVERLLLTEQLAAAADGRGAGEMLAVSLRDAEEALLMRAWRRRLDAAVKVGDGEVEALLRQHPQAFHRPRRVRLRNLFKGFSPAGGDAEREALRGRMGELLAELRAGADFAALALRESQSQSRFQGGLLAFVEAGQLRPEMDRVAMALAKGQLSEVIETTEGLTILRCEQILPAARPSAAEQRERLAANLRRQKVQQQWQEERRSLLETVRPTYRLETARDPAALARAAVLRLRGGGGLSVAELEQLLRRRGAKRSRTELAPERLRQRLEDFAVQTAAARRARQLGLAAAAELAERIGWQRLEILAQEELRQRVESRFELPSEEEVRAFHAAHPEKLKRLPHFELEVVQLILEAADPRPGFELARGLARRLRAGEVSFAEAARQHSDHPSAAAGGSLGRISRRAVAQLGPNPFKAVTAMAPGEISDPVRQDDTLWIFRLLAVEAERPLRFAEAREHAERLAANRRLEQLQADLEAELTAALEVRLPTQKARPQARLFFRPVAGADPHSTEKVISSIGIGLPETRNNVFTVVSAL